MPSISRHCPDCNQYASVEVIQNQKIICPQCQSEWAKKVDIENVFDRCPVCECRQFYLMKDFNQFIGCSIMLAGIVLVPFTYGLSLPVFAGIDYLLHKKVGTLIVCYRCAAEFRGFKTKKKFKPFMHHIGLKYDKYR